MPDLPNVGMERDLDNFREYFENPAFRTDGLKIYPTPRHTWDRTIRAMENWEI